MATPPNPGMFETLLRLKQKQNKAQQPTPIDPGMLTRPRPTLEPYSPPHPQPIYVNSQGQMQSVDTGKPVQVPPAPVATHAPVNPSTPAVPTPTPPALTPSPTQQPYNPFANSSLVHSVLPTPFNTGVPQRQADTQGQPMGQVPLPLPPTIQQGTATRQAEDQQRAANFPMSPENARINRNTSDLNTRLGAVSNAASGLPTDARSLSIQDQQAARAGGIPMDFSGYQNRTPPPSWSGQFGQMPGEANPVNDINVAGATPLPADPNMAARIAAGKQMLQQETARQQADPQFQAREQAYQQQGKQVAAAAREQNLANNIQRQQQQNQQVADIRNLRREAAIQGVSVQTLARQRAQEKRQAIQAQYQQQALEADKKQRQQDENATAGFDGRTKNGQNLRFDQQPPEIKRRVQQNALDGAEIEYDKLMKQPGAWALLDRKGQQNRAALWARRNTHWIF